jgi:hypothetical protein
MGFRLSEQGRVKILCKETQELNKYVPEVFTLHNNKVKVKQCLNKPGQALKFPEVEEPRFQSN